MLGKNNGKRVIIPYDASVAGNSSNLYYDSATGKMYYWNGSEYKVWADNIEIIDTVQPTPTATGNTTNLNKIFKDADGTTWFVDSTGKAIAMGSQTTAINGLSIHENGEVKLGGELIESTLIDNKDNDFTIKNDNGVNYVEQTFYSDSIEHIVANQDTGRTTSEVQNANVKSITAERDGGSSQLRVSGEDLVLQGQGDNPIILSQQNGIYKIENVKYDRENDNEFFLVIDANGNVEKTNNKRPDGQICYSKNTNLNIIADPDEPLDLTDATALAGGTPTNLALTDNYATFTNTGQSVGVNFMQINHIHTLASTFTGVTGTTDLFITLSAPNLTTIANNNAFASVIGQKMTLSIPLALHTHPAIVELGTNNTITLIDSASVPNGFKKVIQNRMISYFDALGNAITDESVIDILEASIQDFSLVVTSCEVEQIVTDFTAITNGFRFINEESENDDVTFEVNSTDPNNVKVEVKLNGVKVAEFPLYTINNDIQINNAGSEWDLTDDQITIKETNGDTQAINFPYRCTVVANANGTIDIKQNGVTIGTIPAPTFFKELNQWHVDPNGNNTTGSGADEKPYLTITKALQTATQADSIIVNEGTYNELITISTQNLTLRGQGAEYGGLTEIVQGIIVNADGTSVRVSSLTNNGTTTHTGTSALYLSDVTLKGNYTSSTTAYSEIKHSRLQDGTTSKTGAGILFITDSLIGNATFTTPNSVISLRNVTIDVGKTVTIGAGVIYSMQDVVGNVVINASAIPLETVLLAQGASALVAKLQECSTFNDIRLTNVNTVTGATMALVRDADGIVRQQAIGGQTFSQVVYVNDLPASATIFDDENPPLINDNSLKNLDNAIYIVVSADPLKNGQIWSSNGTTYSTYTSPQSNDWKILGNAGTNPAVNFLGTLDAQNLVFRTNNIIRWIMDSANGRLSFGGAPFLSPININNSTYPGITKTSATVQESIFDVDYNEATVSGARTTITGTTAVGSIPANTYRLRMERSNAPNFAVTRHDGYVWIFCSSTGSFDVGINTTTPQYKLDINGTARIVTTPTITTATMALVKDPITGQVSEQLFPSGLPSGGTDGQVLTVQPNGSYAWESLPDAPLSGQNVYFNAENPASGTIFDTENPPVTNNDPLKNDSANTYFGTDGSVWTWNGTAYVTKTYNFPVHQPVHTFIATTGQTSFASLPKVPVGAIWGRRNSAGRQLSFTNVGTTVIYTPANNGGMTMDAGDIVEICYEAY